MEDPDNSLAFNAMNTLKRDIKNDLIEAYSLSEPLVRKYNNAFWASNSFLDFLIQISNLPDYRMNCSKLPVNRSEQMTDLNNCRKELERCKEESEHVKQQMTDSLKKLKNYEKDYNGLSEELERIKKRLNKCVDENADLSKKLQQQKDHANGLELYNNGLQQRLRSYESQLEAKDTQLSLQYQSLKDIMRSQQNQSNDSADKMLSIGNAAIIEDEEDICKNASESMTSESSMGGLFKNSIIPMESSKAESENTAVQDLKFRCNETFEKLCYTQRELKEANVKINTLKTQLNETQSKFEKSETEKNECLEKLKDVDDNLNTLKKNLYETQINYKQLEIEKDNCLKELKLAKETLKPELNEVEGMTTEDSLVLKLEEDNKNLKQQIKDKEKECKEQIKKLELELKATSSQLHAKNGLIEYLKIHYNNLFEGDKGLLNTDPVKWEEPIKQNLEKDFYLLNIFKRQIDLFKNEADMINVKPEEFAEYILDLKRKNPTTDLEKIAQAANLKVDDQLVKKISKRIQEYDENYKIVVNFEKCYSMDQTISTVETAENFKKWVKTLPSLLLDLQNTVKEYNQNLDCKNPDWLRHVIYWIRSENRVYENCKAIQDELLKLTPDIILQLESGYMETETDPSHTTVAACQSQIPPTVNKCEWKNLFVKRYHNLINCANTLIEEGDTFENLPEIMKNIKDLVLSRTPNIIDKKDWLYRYIQQNIPEKMEETKFSLEKNRPSVLTECKRLALRYNFRFNPTTFFDDIVKVVNTNAKLKKLLNKHPKFQLEDLYIGTGLMDYFDVNCLNVQSISNRIQAVFVKCTKELFPITEIPSFPHPPTSNLTFKTHAKVHCSNLKEISFKVVKQDYYHQLSEIGLNVDRLKPSLDDLVEIKANEKFNKSYQQYLNASGLDSSTKEEDFLNNLEKLKKKPTVKRIASTTSEIYETNFEKKMKLESEWSVVELQKLVHALYAEYFLLRSNELNGKLPTQEEILNTCQKKLDALQKLQSNPDIRPNVLMNMYTDYIKLDLTLYMDKPSTFNINVVPNMEKLLHSCMRETAKKLEKLYTKMDCTPLTEAATNDE